MIDSCIVFRGLAINTWHTIAESRLVDYQLKEETITDLIVLNLKRLLNGKVFTQTFTKPAEGKNGSDWEFWFKDVNGSWIGFSVQAKIIDIHTNRFKDLHYSKTNKKGVREYQSDKIVRESLKSTPKRIPIYVLYCHWVDKSIVPAWSCCSFSELWSSFGCSFISAVDVIKRRGYDRLSSLLPLMTPWHCLTCCENQTNDGLSAKRMDRYARNRFFKDYSATLEELGITLPDTFVTKDPPAYVLELIAVNGAEALNNPPQDLDGIFVYVDLPPNAS